MKRAGVVLAVVFGTASGALAEGSGVCGMVQTFMQQSAERALDGPDVTIALPAPFPAKQTCGETVFMSGQRSSYCNWAFAYRSDAATQAFTGVLADLESCGVRIMPKKAAKPVNHPDSYEQQVFEIKGERITVALKDKGALQETYIFLSATHPRR